MEENRYLKDGVTWEEVCQFVDEQRQIDFIEAEIERKKWIAETEAKAPEIIKILREYLPIAQREEVEELLSSAYGAEYLSQLLRAEAQPEPEPYHAAGDFGDDDDLFGSRRPFVPWDE